jgi:hypothetical protein
MVKDEVEQSIFSYIYQCQCFGQYEVKQSIFNWLNRNFEGIIDCWFYKKNYFSGSFWHVLVIWPLLFRLNWNFIEVVYTGFSLNLEMTEMTSFTRSARYIHLLHMKGTKGIKYNKPNCLLISKWKKRVHRENHWPATSHWQTLSHNVVSSLTSK